MSSVDNRVVEMKFDNSQFQKGVSDTSSALDKLKQGLNLGGAAQGLDNLNAAGSRFSLAHIATGVDQLGAKFSTMSVAAITAISNIANRAVDAGISIAKSLTIDPITTGLAEYETNLKSVQTILANTQVSGATLGDVNAALDELNHYSDQTIYNFSEMAKNIGTFTAAGVDLKTSTASIKGIANLAALSGSSSNQAANAMYQLSQEIAGGKVTLMGWNSVVNAGMGGSTFQRTLAETAVAMGKVDRSAVTLEGSMKNVKIEGQSFRDSISAETGSGWLSADVLTTALSTFTGDMTDAELAAKGFTEEQIKSIQATAKTARAAATEVKTLSGVFDTAKEVAGSGWAKTWQLIFGDFEEAKTLFTGMSNAVNEVLEGMSKERNEVLAQWKILGGRNDIIDGVKSGWSSIVKIFEAVRRAFTDIFPPVTGQNLKDITESFKRFMESLTPSTVTLINIQRVAKGLFAVLDIGRMIIMGVVGVIQRLLGEVGKGSGGVLEFAADFGDMLVKFRQSIIDGNAVNAIFYKIHFAISKVQEAVKQAVDWFNGLFKSVEKVEEKGSKSIQTMKNLGGSLNPLAASADHVRNVWDKMGDVFRKVGEFFAPLGEKIRNFATNIGKSLSEGVGGSIADTDWNLVLDSINTGLFAGLVLMVRKFFSGGFGGGDEDDMGLMDRIKGVFSGMTDTLDQMQNTLKAGTLLTIAAAIALLAGSAVALSTVDSGKLTQVLGAMAVLMVQLMTAMAVFDRINPVSSIGSLIGMGTAMILLAIAIRILAESVEELGKMDWKTLLKGLGAVTGLLLGLAVAAKIMSTQNGVMARTGIALMLVAVAIKILASAVKDFAVMDWQKMMQGLIAVGMVLGGLAIFTRLADANSGGLKSGVGLILLAVAIKLLASAVADFGAQDWQKMMQGLIAMGMVLGGLAIFSQVVNPAQMVSMGVSLVIIAASMKIFASAINDLGNIDWQKMMQGLIAMGMMLGGLAIFSRLVNPAQMVSMGISMILIGVALKMLVDVIKELGGMSWEQLNQGMLAMAAALVIMAVATNMMVGALPGAAALLIVVAALTLFVPVLQQLGAMSWEAIWTGIGALALSLLTLGVAGAVLGVLSPLFALFGISLILIGAGAALAGVGLLAFATGLTVLAAAGAAGTAVLISVVMALAGMLPAVMVLVGQALVAFAQVIIDSAPKFGEAITVVLLTLLQIINTIAPQIIQTLWNLVVLMVEALVRGIPYLVDAGMRLIIGILEGIGRNIGKVVDAGANIIVEFLNGLSRNVPRMTEAGVNLIITFVESLATSIRNNSSRMETAGRNLAGAIIDGMTAGIRGGISAVAEAAGNVAKSALDTVKSWLGIKSPSREFKKIGRWSTEGMAIGMTEYSGLVDKAAVGVGETAVNSMRQSMSNVGSFMEDQMDFEPNIRPVLDLSDIQDKSRKLGSLLTPPTLELNGSYAKAASLVERERANREAAASSSDISGEAVRDGDVYNFNQTINSPKAISAAETYRGTRSLISMAKDQPKKGAPTK